MFHIQFKQRCHTQIHLYSPYRSSCTRDACQTIPSITLKEQLCQRTCQSMRPVDFEELGLSSKGRCSVLLKKREPPQSTSRNKHTNNQSKGDIESIRSIYRICFFPSPFLGAFLYCTIYSLALSCVFFFEMNPRHRGGRTATWELVLWHSGSSRARCNSKRSSCRGGRSQDGRLDDRMAGWQETVFFQGWFAMLKAFWLGPGMTRLKALGLFCHLLSAKEYPYEWCTLTRVGICWSLQYL